jgi:hypothetical protein
MGIQVDDDGGRAELEADVLERLVREVHEAEAAIAGYQEMLAIAQRQGMTYEQQWMPGQIARLQVTVNEIVVLWPEAVEFEAKRRREHCNAPRHQPWCEGCVTR